MRCFGISGAESLRSGHNDDDDDDDDDDADDDENDDAVSARVDIRPHDPDDGDDSLALQKRVDARFQIAPRNQSRPIVALFLVQYVVRADIGPSYSHA